MAIFEISHNPWYNPTSLPIPWNVLPLSQTGKDYCHGIASLVFPFASLSKTLGTPMAALSSVSHLFYFFCEPTGQLKSLKKLQLGIFNVTQLALDGLSIISFIFRKTLVGLALCDGARFCFGLNSIFNHKQSSDRFHDRLSLFHCTAYAFSSLFHMGLLLYGSPLLLGSFFIAQTLTQASAASYCMLKGQKNSFNSLAYTFSCSMLSLLMVKSFYSLLTGNLE